MLNIKKYEIEVLQELCQQAEEQVRHDKSAYGQLEKKIIKKSSLSLLEGEVCFYEKKASSFHQKNVVTGTKSNGAGVRVRLTKGLSVGIGGGETTSIRENVNEYFEGTLYITNMRLVLLAPKYGFDVMIPKITSIAQKKDGFQVFVGAKCYSVATSDVKNIMKIMELMNKTFEAQTEGRAPSQKKDIMTIAKEIREYKKLVDDGIITLEEFKEKKKQLMRS